MENLNTFLIILIWISSGIHSIFLLKYRSEDDFDFKDLLPLYFICILVPFVSHIATLITYPKK